MAAAAGPPKSAKDLWRALRQLVARLRPERWRIVAAALIGSAGVGFLVAAPRIIGNATNLLFDGLIGKALPAGMSQAQAEAYLRLHGQGQLAQMLTGTTVNPGHGIDFNQLGVSLGVIALLYLVGAVFSWARDTSWPGGAAHRLGMRRDVEAKLARLPLQYFDSHPHGDVLSRVTNDIDNVTTTLQQGLSQLLTSILTIIGVLAMMLWISPLLALISLVMVPMSIGSRSSSRGDPEAVHLPVGPHRHREQSRGTDPHRPCPGPGLRSLPPDGGRVRPREPGTV